MPGNGHGFSFENRDGGEPFLLGSLCHKTDQGIIMEYTNSKGATFAIHIPQDYRERMDAVLSESWRIFKAQFTHGRHEVQKEAPFQHHFAQIIREVGNLYCLSEKDLFKVDLETKCEDVRGKSKYIDITCSFVDQVKCAIELKFKTAKQGAQEHGRIDVYLDLEALEHVKGEHYDMTRFYMITDSTAYIKQSKRGVGTVFSTHEGHTTAPGQTLQYDSKGRENVSVVLRKEYTFHWEEINSWYFLEIKI